MRFENSGFGLVPQKKKKNRRKTPQGWERFKREQVRLKGSGTKYQEKNSVYRTYYLTGSRVHVDPSKPFGERRETEELDLISLGKLTDDEFSFWKAVVGWMKDKSRHECLIDTSKKICECYACYNLKLKHQP